MWLILFLCLFFTAPSLAVLDASPQPVIASVVWSHEHGFKVVHGISDTKHTVGVANYTNAINQTGWAYLEIETYEHFPDTIQAHAAGYLEGYVTSSLLHMSWTNTVLGRCDGKEELCGKIQAWVDANHRWVSRKVKHHKKKSAYWHQVGLFYAQMKSLAKGYAAATEGKDMHISLKDIVTMNIFGDLEDLENALGDTEVPAKVMGQGHCSALVRVLPDGSDLLVSHDTWNSFQSMLRILKKYTLPFHIKHRSKAKVAGHTMTFSGYPGIIYSGDDFTLASSGLTILETTIGNSNPDLWSNLKPAGSVLEGIRSTIANRMATTGKDWVKWFSKWNSGTYNNQWMVLDYKLFKPNKTKESIAQRESSTANTSSLPTGLFWVLEQIPGYIQSKDLTHVLDSQQFWPSYNSPYFPDVFNMSGNRALMEKYGDWFSYENTPRAKIFRRDIGSVVDVGSMVHLMRYNNYTLDPLSACNCTPPYSAENAISARCDLNPKNGTYPFGALGHRSHGGTDMKLTNTKMFQNLEFLAQSGPTWDPLPPFRWSLQDFANDTNHVGHPDLWQFPPVEHKWTSSV